MSYNHSRKKTSFTFQDKFYTLHIMGSVKNTMFYMWYFLSKKHNFMRESQFFIASTSKVYVFPGDGFFHCFPICLWAKLLKYVCINYDSGIVPHLYPLDVVFVLRGPGYTVPRSNERHNFWVIQNGHWWISGFCECSFVFKNCDGE